MPKNHPKMTQQILDDLAAELVAPVDGNTDYLMVVAVAGAEESMLVDKDGEPHDLKGVGVRIGSVLLDEHRPANENPIVTSHLFFLPPTAALETAVMLLEWVQHYMEAHVDSDPIYKDEMYQLLEQYEMDTEEG